MIKRLTTAFRLSWWMWLALGVVLLASLVRFYELGQVPHGMTWDEAAIGYNGHAIWTTRRDEWLVRLPTSFRSFGDYKTPVAIYLSGGFSQLFGLNLWAVRLPFALSGVVGVMGLMLLAREWGRAFGWSEGEQKSLSIVAGLILATSPWHIHYSRTGFESGLALTLMIWSVYWLIKGLSGEKIKWRVVSLGTLAATLSVYSYHSAKIVMPILGLSILWQFKKQVRQNWRGLAVVGLLALGLLYPLIKDSLYGKGLERASTLIVAKTDSVFELIKILSEQFLAHLSPAFLVMGESTTLRHGDGQWGVWLAPVFLLIVLGFVAGLKSRRPAGWNLAIIWTGAGILPAALGAELVPHSNRALLALPGFLLLGLIGLCFLSSWILKSKINQKIIGSHGEKNMVWVSVMGTLLLWQALLFVRYTHDYFNVFAQASASDFADGYLETFNYVKQFEPDVEKIIFTSDYGQPYIFALFARKTNPIWYQGGSLVKYEFKDVNAGDLAREKALIVASQNDTDLPSDQADKLIYGSDGQVRFKIFRR